MIKYREWDGRGWEPGGARLDSLNDGTTYEKFGFDARGRTETIDYAPALNTNRRKYTFDERGNPLSETFGGATRSFRYDKADRLTYSTDWAGVETELDLHPDGTRNFEVVGGVSRQYVYSQIGRASCRERVYLAV